MGLGERKPLCNLTLVTNIKQEMKRNLQQLCAPRPQHHTHVLLVYVVICETPVEYSEILSL